MTRSEHLALKDAERRLVQEVCRHPKNAREDLKWGYRCRACGKVNP